MIKHRSISRFRSSSMSTRRVQRCGGVFIQSCLTNDRIIRMDLAAEVRRHRADGVFLHSPHEAAAVRQIVESGIPVVQVIRPQEDVFDSRRDARYRCRDPCRD